MRPLRPPPPPPTPHTKSSTWTMLGETIAHQPPPPLSPSCFFLLQTACSDSCYQHHLGTLHAVVNLWWLKIPACMDLHGVHVQGLQTRIRQCRSMHQHHCVATQGAIVVC